MYGIGLKEAHTSQVRPFRVVILEITKKEPKSDNRFSKFDWYDLSPIFLAIMLLHNVPKSILETNKTAFASYSLIQ